MELSMLWPATAISLESLRPLSPDNFEDDQIATDVDKLSRSELAGKLLDHFDGIQNEESDPFGWYTHEKSIEIPIFDSLPSPPYNVDPKASAPEPVYLDAATIDAGDYERQQAAPPLYHSSALLAAAYQPLPSFYASPSTAQPFEEPAVVPLAQPAPPAAPPADYAFADVSGDREPAPAASNNGEWLKREALTPPDSPKEEEILKMLEEMESAELETLMAGADQFAALESFAPPAPASPAAYSDEDSDSSAPTDDPEWTPPARQSARASRRSSTYCASTSKNCASKYCASNSKYSASSASKYIARSASIASTKRRSAKPYSKSGAEERRERKKEQNKNAATRYRLKKKAEVEEVKLEEHQLEEDNAALRKQVDELCREIRYLKSLMREVYRKKGLLK